MESRMIYYINENRQKCMENRSTSVCMAKWQRNCLVIRINFGEKKDNLRVVSKFLKWKSNIFIHRFIDDGNLLAKIRLPYHRTTHTPEFIEKILKEQEFSDKDNFETYFHIFQDLGIARRTREKIPRKRRIKKEKSCL
ncbi:MAG: hypothetical protein ACP5JO_06885 [Candidatus Ratteibacteria bacterium]